MEPTVLEEDDAVPDDFVLYKCLGCEIEWWGEPDEDGRCEICGMVADMIQAQNRQVKE
ncbi:MAG: hypothetical protein M0R06_13095 [Sphaerochaeta sp.]|jgi:hypothetical protein|nr:hypothetical protein [Sphaerochaeta sp.]